MPGLSILALQEGLVSVPSVESKMQKHRHGDPAFWGPFGERYNLWAAWSPAVRPHPRWRGAELSERPVVALEMVGVAYNFGHFLIDQVLPTLLALQAFGLDAWEEEVQLVTRYSCKELGHIFEGVHGQAPQPKDALCQRNYREWLDRYFFRFPLVVLGDKDGAARDGLCFRRMLVGHNAGFSQLSAPHDLFAPAARRFRNRVLDRIFFAPRAPADARDHGVLVLLKQEGWLTSGLWPSVCDDVASELRSSGVEVRLDAAPGDDWDPLTSTHAPGPQASVRCADPADLPLEAQVRFAALASTVVSLHGTVSFLLLFAPDGASALVAGKEPLKETPVLLTLSTLLVLYLNLDADLPHLGEFLLRCLRHSAARFALWSV